MFLVPAGCQVLGDISGPERHCLCPRGPQPAAGRKLIVIR